MCGIVGYIGTRDAATILLQGLRRLEYRGYDSAGIAIWNGAGIEVRRAEGKLDNLERVLAAAPAHGHRGIGHTRWATHGRPCERNAHPHRAGRVVVIHNGIIENYPVLRAELQARGRAMSSETDSEVIAHLIDVELDQGRPFEEALRAALARLEGSFAVVAMSETEPDMLLAAKSATPVVLGLGDGEGFVASDIPALLDHTREVIFLEDGEIARVEAGRIAISRFDGTPVQRAPRRITWDPITAQKGGYKHFLAKEIHEQPQAVLETIRGRAALEQGRVSLDHEVPREVVRWPDLQRIDLVGCGTAWHACLVAKFYFERLAGIPCTVDYASEYRYRGPVLGPGTLLLAVSQSGETADTLAAVETAREHEVPTLAVCNVVDSSIARRSQAVLYTHAGPEISVASTKAFTTQLTALLLLALDAGVARGVIGAEEVRETVHALVDLPGRMEEVLAGEERIAAVARAHAQARDVLYLGRGLQYPIALEGALKLKEISYIHAEGYPAGEMKHGPIALVSEEMPVVVLLPRDRVFGKTLSNLKEVESRGGRIVVVTDDPEAVAAEVSGEVLAVPRVAELVMPILLSLPLQLFAYHVAVHRGTDVDQPRNLAKSVTVE